MSSSRSVIEDLIESNPGLGFSQVKKKSGFSNGVLEYNLRKSKNIEKEKGAYVPKSYCNKCSFKSKCKEKCILKEIRKEPVKTIIKEISEGSRQIDIARSLDKDRSTVNYHVKKLKEMNILDEEGEKVRIENVGKFY